MKRSLAAHSFFTHTGAIDASRTRTRGRLRMYDVLILFLGDGGILLMAAYAALCERI